jgi:hypothetical protein
MPGASWLWRNKPQTKPPRWLRRNRRSGYRLTSSWASCPVLLLLRENPALRTLRVFDETLLLAFPEKHRLTRVGRRRLTDIEGKRSFHFHVP